jgi:hypothetical protein
LWEGRKDLAIISGTILKETAKALQILARLDKDLFAWKTGKRK